jgi:hypothetical protein
MRKILLVAVAVALFTAAFAGVAGAKSFVCKTILCEGTHNPDQIGERNGSVPDVIRARGRDDQVNASRAGNDRDYVLGQKGDDVLDLADGDFRDNGNCGPGDDVVIIDFQPVFGQGSPGDIDGIKGCETVVFDNGESPPEAVASLSKEDIITNSTPVPAEVKEAAEAKGK